MKNKAKYIYSLFLTFFISYHFSFAQQTRSEASNKIIETIVENLSTNADEDADYSELTETLTDIAENPFNLNSVSSEELKELVFLNDIQIEAIIEYKQKYGEIYSIYELGAIPELDETTIQFLLPFVYVENAERKLFARKFFNKGYNQLFLRTGWTFQEQKGYQEQIQDSVTSTKYIGSKYKIYSRYSFEIKKNIRFGFTTEKDAGEKYFTQKKGIGIEFVSAFLQIQKVGKIRNMVIGDYGLAFGQGLTFSTAMNMGKSPLALSIERFPVGIRKYSSTDENRFFRGIASTLRFGQIDFTGFISYKRIDASLKTDSTDEDLFEYFSPQFTGLHTTTTEIDNKDAVKETIFGGNISWYTNRFRLSATYGKRLYNIENKKNEELYNVNAFLGKTLQNFSVDYSTFFRNQKARLFGEIALSDNSAIAINQGFVVQAYSFLGFSFLYRNYSEKYHGIYSNAFGENTESTNEEGSYLGINTKIIRRVTISAFADVFTFPWLKYRINSPSYGNDFFIQASYSPKRNINIYLRFKQKEKSENDNTTFNKIQPNVSVLRKSLRLDISVKYSDGLELGSRAEICAWKKETETETGFLLFQDISYRFSNLPLKLSTRLCVFKTESWNSRIYTFEDDVLYAYSVPAYSGSGVRNYLVIKYSPIRVIDLCLKVGNQIYNDRNIVGSGYNEISGNKKTDIKLQLRLRF